MKNVLLSIALSTAFASSAFAQDTVKQTSLGTAAAVELANAAVAACSAEGYNVAAAVTDRAGILLALVRAENAGAHTANAATAKAYTSASSRNPTSGMAETVSKTPQLPVSSTFRASWSWQEAFRSRSEKTPSVQSALVARPAVNSMRLALRRRSRNLLTG